MARKLPVEAQVLKLIRDGLSQEGYGGALRDDQAAALPGGDLPSSDHEEAPDRSEQGSAGRALTRPTCLQASCGGLQA